MTLRKTMLALALGALTVVAADIASTSYLQSALFEVGRYVGGFPFVGHAVQAGISFNGLD